MSEPDYEAAAIGLWTEDGAEGWESWEVMPERVRERWRRRTQTAVDALVWRIEVTPWRYEHGTTAL